MDDLFDKYAATTPGTNTGTDKNGYHTYGPVYEKLFRDITRTDVTAVLELGVDSGASLMIWADCFPNARIVGVDITVDHVKYSHPRVSVVHGDATASDAIPALRHATFDIVIDDASHTLEDQCAAIRWWAPRVRHLMIVEDVLLTPESHDMFLQVARDLQMKMKIHDVRGPGLPDDNVLVVFTRETTHTRSSGD